MDCWRFRNKTTLKSLVDSSLLLIKLTNKMFTLIRSISFTRKDSITYLFKRLATALKINLVGGVKDTTTVDRSGHTEAAVTVACEKKKRKI